MSAGGLRAAMALLVAGMLALGLPALLGCSAKKAMVPNLPPETTVFVAGDLDTVNHVVHLYWFGSDPDGFVVDYEVRFLNPSDPADTVWTSTSTVVGGRLQIRTDSLFTVFIPDGYAEPVFEVRAVDEDGDRDPTPATQTFKLSNEPPTVRFVNVPALNDTSFATVTLTWLPTDPDGDLQKMKYRVWLDGNQANPVIATGTTFTVPTDQFRQGGQLLSGYRTAYVQAIDDGGRASTVDSTKWYVRAPVTGTRARLLIVDDVPSSNPSSINVVTDTLFTEAATRAGIAPDEYTILRLETTQPFRSSKDLEQTLELFEAVVWYRGLVPGFQNMLRSYQDGIAAYLDAGGRICLEGLQLVDGVNASGALNAAFADQYLNVDGLFRRFEATLGDSTAGWGNGNGDLFLSVFGDTVNTTGTPAPPGIRAFRVRDAADILVYAPAGELAGNNPIDMPIGLSVPQASGGRMIALAFPLAYANRSINPGGRRAFKIVEHVVDQLGLTGP